jgi:transcriptional regulator with XRE-family HTH domain
MSSIYDSETGAVASSLPMRRFQQARRSAFGPMVRRRRLDRCLSRTELGGLLGLDGAYVAAVEESHLMPTLDTVFALADALDAAPADLLRDAERAAESALYRELRVRLGDRPS